MKQNPKIQEIYKSLQKSLELVYNHYCKITAGKEGVSSNFLILPGFNKFCAQFRITPDLLSVDDCLKVFRILTKSKSIQGSGVNSLDFEDFKEACLRISQLNKRDMLGADDENLKNFFEYLKVNSDTKHVRELVKNIEINAAHNRDKKRTKNQNNQSVSREITPVNSAIRSKSTTKKKTENETNA